MTDKFEKETESFFNQYYRKERKDKAKCPFSEFLFRYTINPAEYILKILKKQGLFGKKNLRFLEIGCGDGTYTFYTSRFFKNCLFYGIDISGTAVRLCKENSRKDEFNSSEIRIGSFSFNHKLNKFLFLKNDGLKLPLPDNCLDVVYCVSVLHHTFKYGAMMSEAYRVLKKGAILIILDLKGHGFLVRKLLSLLRFFPKQLLIKVFGEDLILENGEIPLRSDVRLSKLKRIFASHEMKVVEEQTVTFFLNNFLYIFLRVVYKISKINFSVYKPILLVLVKLDLILRRIFPDQCEVFALVVKKT